MGMNHVAPRIPNRRTRIKGIRARLYPAHSVSPKAITAHFKEDTQQPNINRFVFAGDLLSKPRLQPYIHDVILTIRYCGKSFKFLVFFKKHKLLPPNETIRNLQGECMNGDVLVVACGKRVSIRNLRSGLEDRAADRAIKRLTQALHPIDTRRRFPSAISFM